MTLKNNPEFYLLFKKIEIYWVGLLKYLDLVEFNCWGMTKSDSMVMSKKTY